MQKTIYECDRCKQEQDIMTKISVIRSRNVELRSRIGHGTDLCEVCARSLVGWIKGERTNEVTR